MHFADGLRATTDRPLKRAANFHPMRDPRYPAKLMLCLGTIYLVWGSSFLFTKIAVGTLPPALF